jgi:hypothetical protein
MIVLLFQFGTLSAPFMTRETVGQEGSRLMMKKDNLQNACEENSMQSRQDISFGIYM